METKSAAISSKEIEKRQTDRGSKAVYRKSFHQMNKVSAYCQMYRTT